MYELVETDKWCWLTVAAFVSLPLCSTYRFAPKLTKIQEYGGYISDITRTWPVNGKFSGPQRDLYNAVLTVQRKCVSLCRENANLSLDDLHEIAEEGLAEQMELLGFETHNVCGHTCQRITVSVFLLTLVLFQGTRALFPHHLGHFVGLEVHDCPGYPRNEKLRKGQCVTIEP
jgi:intermediate cleaving peptidase 55